MLRKWGHILAIILAGIVLALMTITPPSPQGVDTSAHEFSSARAMEDIRIIAAKPHPTGSEENAKVREYLAQRLTALGLDVTQSEAKLGERALARLNRWSGEAKTEQKLVNIIGILPGQNRTKPALLLMAHHDTVWGSPGAADDTVGIASILEIIRALNEDGPQRRDVIVLFTDAEELGLVGATHFFGNNPLHERIGAIINFEARGGGGTANMFQTSANNGAAVRLYARSVKQPSTSSLSTFIYSVLPNDTDLTPALEKDYVAYNIANIGEAKYYHSPKIDAKALDEATLQHMGSQGLDLSKALLSADALPAPSKDTSFFDVFGIFTLIYAAYWGWAFLAIAIIFYAASVKSSFSVKEIIGGLLKSMGFLLLGGVVLYGLNVLSGAGSGADYYDRLAAIPRLEIIASLICVVMFFALFGRKHHSANERLGAALPLLTLGVAGQTLAPTAAYFITLPIMLCAVASLIMHKPPHKLDSRKLVMRLIALVLAALVVGYMFGLHHLLMVGVGPDMLSVAILPAALAIVAILPFFPGLSKRMNTTLVMSGLAIAIVVALWVRFDPVAATVPLY